MEHFTVKVATASIAVLALLGGISLLMQPSGPKVQMERVKAASVSPLEPTALPLDELPPTSDPSDASKTFHTPDGNVKCHLSIDAARCDVLEPNWQEPGSDDTTPAVVVTSQDEPARFIYPRTESLFSGCGGCADEAKIARQNELSGPQSLEDSYTLGNLACIIVGNEVSCTNDQTKDGFVISQARYRLF